jgi:hypothetical protein
VNKDNHAHRDKNLLPKQQDNQQDNQQDKQHNQHNQHNKVDKDNLLVQLNQLVQINQEKDGLHNVVELVEVEHKLEPEIL